MKKLKLLIGCSCDKIPGKLLALLEENPKIKFNLHLSGFVYEQGKDKLALLKKLVKRRQIEIISAGFYDPILALIPDQDKVGQIKMSNDFIQKEFKFLPSGVNLTQNMWQPDLAKQLCCANIEYAILDQFHFISQSNLYGYYLVEEQGNLVKLFPVNERLKEFKGLEGYLKEVHSANPSATMILFDQLENLDLKWFELLKENSNLISTYTFSEYLEEYEAIGRIYLPSGPLSVKNELIKYPEANNLHKKMLLVSQKLETLKRGKALVGGSEKEKRLKKAVKELYKGQSRIQNIHAKEQRQERYQHLIKAEVEIEKNTRANRSFVDLSVMDFNKDGQDEVILSNDLLNLYFAPAAGGSIFELDYKPRAINVMNSFSQDQTFSLQDHFFSPDSKLDNRKEVGDFIRGQYAFMPRRIGTEAGLLLSKDGLVENIPIKIEKLISICAKQSIVQVEYAVANMGQETGEFWLGIEFQLSLGQKEKVDKIKVSQYKVVDADNKIEVLLELEKPGILWVFPNVTLSGSDKGLEQHYQNQVVIPSWKIKLDPGQVWKNKLTLRIEE